MRLQKNAVMQATNVQGKISNIGNLQPSQIDTFSVGGGGIFTVSAS